MFLQIGGIQAQENREFTNTAGKKISGKVTAATDKDVTIQMPNGREITGGLNFFSKEDQDYIAKWREQKDDLEGIWIKIVSDGKAVYEERSGSKDVKGGKWIEPAAPRPKK